MNSYNNLIKIVEKISVMMGEFEDRALNSDELSDLTVKQIYYLDSIAKLKKPTFSELAEELEVTKPTVTMAVNRLINLGYISKVQSEQDKRVYHLLLTEKGERVVSVHNQAHRDFAREISSKLSDNELEKLVKILVKVTGNQINE